MKTKLTYSVVLSILFLTLFTGCGTLSTSTGNDNGDPIEASGVIEARQVNIGSEIPGRIAEVLVEEGAQVEAGQILIRLEDDLLLSQQAQAQAAYRAAEAALESSLASVEAAQANLQLAQAVLDGAEISYQNILAEVQTLEGANRVDDWNQALSYQYDQPAWYFQQPEQIAAAESLMEDAKDAYLEELENYQDTVEDVSDGQLEDAEQRLAEARAAFQIAETLSDRQVGYTASQELTDLIEDIYQGAENELEEAQDAFDRLLTEAEYDEILDARARVTVAREQYDLARDLLYEQYRGENSFQVQAAAAQLAQAEAAFAAARAQLDQAEIARLSAESAVQQAAASLEGIELQLEKLDLFSSLSGVVVTRTVEPGEIISAGFTALTVADLSQLTVTVYLPEDRYGQIALGDTANVSVDSYPEDLFKGKVIWISDRAEYTPRNVQTQEERQNTVYAVKLSVPGSSKLKPGMPADVVFQP